jgi:hypothetical protein
MTSNGPAPCHPEAVIGKKSGNSTSANVKKAQEAAKQAKAAMTDPEREVIGSLPDIPESARLALQYAIWVAQQEGRELKHGTTAAYMHLSMILAEHLKPLN